MKLYRCKNCGYQGKARVRVKGTFALELLLYLLFIVPGIAYTIWRKSNTYTECPKCGAPYMIPEDR